MSEEELRELRGFAADAQNIFSRHAALLVALTNRFENGITEEEARSAVDSIEGWREVQGPDDPLDVPLLFKLRSAFEEDRDAAGA